MTRTLLSLAVAASLLTVPLAHAQDHAQDAGPAAAPQDADVAAQPAGQSDAGVDAKTLDAVTVTARRRKETIQSVPVAVSAFNQNQLRDMQASNVDGLQGAVPNMNIVEGRGSANSVNVFIRGIGQPDALQTFDPGVGMYVDDVYYSRINGGLLSMFDVADVEVLRGPQGTLYGKNSTGGAIKITTKDPFTDTGGAFELTAGNYGREEARFYAGGQLSDTVAASVAAVWTGNDGYVKDPATGRRYNDDDTKAIRAKLAFKPSDAFEATLSVDYTHQNAAPTLGQQTAPLTGLDVGLLLSGLPYNVVLLQPPTGGYHYTAGTAFGPDQGQLMTHKGASLNMSWNLDQAWLLKSITAYRELDSASYIDIDATPLQLGDVFVNFHQKQFSQEFQLQYDNGGPVKAIMGAYYLKERLPSHQEAYANNYVLFFGAPVDFLRTIDDDQTTTSTAAFANVDWEFVPSWTLSAGVRFTRDKKDYWRTTSAFYGAPLQALSADPQAVIPHGTSKTWSAVTPSFSLRKTFNENVTAYLSANRGFKSGGFNGRANDPNEAADPVFNPEYVWTYELGVKLQSDDRRLTGRIAAFHSNYKDFQARVSDVLNPGSTTPTFAFPVLNAASMKIDGVEFEGNALIGEGTTLSTQLGWMHARYDEFDDPRTSIDPTLAHLHDHVPFSPDFTGRVALQHVFSLDGGSAVTIGGDASYRSETWLSVDNRPGLKQDAYTLYGLYAGWDSPQQTWQVRAGVRNLGDKTYKTDAQEFSSVANIQTAYYGWPRNWYASLRYNF